MHRRGADDRLLYLLPLARHDRKRVGLGSPEPAVRSHQLLEGGHLARVRVVHLVPMDMAEENGVYRSEGLEIRGWSAAGEMPDVVAQKRVGEQLDAPDLYGHAGMPKPGDSHHGVPGTGGAWLRSQAPIGSTNGV